jgi:tRNA nucleotidyltransferase/poly(A) polymerase
MNVNLPNLASAEWLTSPAVRQIFTVLEGGGEEARVVGGAVRDALMGRPVREVDFATTATPDKIKALAASAGIKAVPTGIEHGTVTLVIGGRGFEITTLREDIETDGRRAVVKFGRDWEADARRRDFTVNALSVDSAGTIDDPVGGYPDIVARRIRFIGDPDQRIAEDRLRMLRLFRFHAEYGEGPIDAAGLSAAIRARERLRELSAERIGLEMRRIVVARRAAEIVTLIQESGILTIVLGGVGYLSQFTRAIHGEEAMGVAPVAATRLAALACRVEEDVFRTTDRLRLSNAERDRVLATISAACAFALVPAAKEARRALYQLGPEAYRDGVIHAFAWSSTPQDPQAWRAVHQLPDRWTAPVFPLGGRDIIGKGVTGSAVGKLLRAVEAWWIEQDFAPDEAALHARLQQMMAAVQ